VFFVGVKNMARHLYIAGVDRWGTSFEQRDLEQNTLEIKRALTYLVDTCSFSVKGERPTEGEEVIIEDNGERLFAGTIVKAELSRYSPDRDRSILVWDVECDDYTALVDKRLVVEVYEGLPAHEIFLDIAAKYCPGFTTNGVMTGSPVVEYIEFDYLPPSECFRQLCDYIGWHWQPDYYKDLQFFSAESLASPAPMKLEQVQAYPGGMFRFGKHSVDIQGLRNRVYVRGGTMLSDFFTHEIKADGVARTWILPHKPHEISMEVNAVPVTVGVENLHEEADYAYMMNFQEKYVRASAQTGTIADGTTISWTYKFDVPVLSRVDDLASQMALAAIQGGDGVYEHPIVDDSLVTIEAAIAAGNADLRDHANPTVKGYFETEVSGWHPGQLVEINLPDRGVVGTYLIQTVTLRPASTKFWTYKIEYGGRLKGIPDLLKALVSAQQKKVVGEPKLLWKIETFEETVQIADEMILTAKEPPVYYLNDDDALVGFAVFAGDEEPPVDEAEYYFISPGFAAKFDVA
jgi:hypothetical protein